MNKTALACLTITAMALGQATSLAQEKFNRVASSNAWSAFEAFDPRECWAATAPQESEHRRDGREVSMQRGDILLFVSWRPGQNVAGEISFTPGYGFAEGSTVTLEIDNESFELFTEDDFAWPASPAEDRKIIAALKRGISAVIKARSALGTETTDRFSLIGATAMIEDASKRCAQ